MELKDFKERPLIMIGRTKCECDFNENTYDAVKEEILKHAVLRENNSVCVIVEGENMDFETRGWVASGPIDDVLKLCLEEGEYIRNRGYEDIFIYYIHHLHIQGLYWGKDASENEPYNPNGNDSVYKIVPLELPEGVDEDDPEYKCIDGPLDFCWTSLEALYRIEDHSELDYGTPFDVFVYDERYEFLYSIEDSEYTRSKFGDEKIDVLEFLSQFKRD